MLELWQEYSQLTKEILRLSDNDRVAISGMTRQPSWASFLSMLDTWKLRIMAKGLSNCVGPSDVAALHAQCRIITYIKTLQKRFDSARMEGVEDTEDPATNIPI
jgi:hypothetical protein